MMLWIAGYWPVSDFGLVLKDWVGVLAEFLGSFYADHVYSLIHVCQPPLQVSPPFLSLLLYLLPSSL